MADVDLTPQDVSNVGVTVTRTALSAADTYHVPFDDDLILNFRKTGAGACVVTFATPKTEAGLAVADRTLNVPATTGDVAISQFAKKLYDNPADAEEEFTFTVSEATGLTCALLKV